MARPVQLVVALEVRLDLAHPAEPPRRRRRSARRGRSARRRPRPGRRGARTPSRARRRGPCGADDEVAEPEVAVAERRPGGRAAAGRRASEAELDRRVRLVHRVQLVWKRTSTSPCGRNGQSAAGIAWMRASSSAICSRQPGGGSRTMRRPIVSPSTRSIAKASRPSSSPRYATGRGTLTPAACAAASTWNSSSSDSVSRVDHAAAARRTSSALAARRRPPTPPWRRPPAAAAQRSTVPPSARRQLVRARRASGTRRTGRRRRRARAR